MSSKPVVRLRSLRQLQEHLQILQGYENPYSIEDFVVPSERNELLIRENAGDLELRICLKTDLLDRLDPMELPKDFNPSDLGELSVAIEELSHFNTYCFRAMEQREVSAIELEVQAEVDKFGVFLDWLHQKNEAHLKEIVFQNLFGELKLGSWVQAADRGRYQDAHGIAKNFCKGLLRENLSSSDIRTKLQVFFAEPAATKLNPKF